MTIDIGSNTVLPASRESLTLHTDDGLSLVAELATPIEREPAATLVTVHPLPTAGGFMDSHVIRKASYRLPALADIAVLRFNTRGTESPHGRSEGQFDEARGERHDIATAVEFAVDRGLPNRWLVGWSFGADLVLKYGCSPAVAGAVLLSPPLRYATDEDLDVWTASQLPMLVLVPEFDDYLRPDAAEEKFQRIPQAKVVGVEGAKHLWVGEKFVQRVLNEVVAAVSPNTGALPVEWDGPSGTASLAP